MVYRLHKTRNGFLLVQPIHNSLGYTRTSTYSLLVFEECTAWILQGSSESFRIFLNK